MSENFKEFRERTRHQTDSLFANMFLNPLTIRTAYFIKKYGLKITANQVSYFRLIFLSSLIILLLFLAPILRMRALYLGVAISFYFILFTDWLDGAIARGTNTTSKKGEFLDSVADRTSILIFFVLILSIGLFLQNNFLIYGGILLFMLKTFNLMLISKIFYSNLIPKKEMSADERYKDKDMLKIFGGDDAKKMGIGKIESFLENINKYLKIKRWNPKITVPERYFLTIMVPALLIFFGLDMIAIYLVGIFVLAFNIFFLKRIITLFNSYF